LGPGGTGTPCSPQFGARGTGTPAPPSLGPRGTGTPCSPQSGAWTPRPAALAGCRHPEWGQWVPITVPGHGEPGFWGHREQGVQAGGGAQACCPLPCFAHSPLAPTLLEWGRQHEPAPCSRASVSPSVPLRVLPPPHRTRLPPHSIGVHFPGANPPPSAPARPRQGSSAPPGPSPAPLTPASCGGCEDGAAGAVSAAALCGRIEEVGGSWKMLAGAGLCAGWGRRGREGDAAAAPTRPHVMAWGRA